METETKIARETGKAGLLQIAAGLWQTIARLLASMVLARTLSPSDFGIFGMAFLGKSFIERLGYFGFGTAIIAKKNVDNKDLCTGFWINAGVRCLLFLIALGTAPTIATFFKTPEIISLLRYLALTFIFTIPSFIPSLLLQKEINFTPISIINMIAVTLECLVAVILAVGFELRYWALGISVIVTIFFIHSAIFLYKIWFPSLVFSKESFLYLIRYGLGGLGTNLAAFFQGNIDYLITGRILGPKTLGLYEFAYRLPHLLQDRVATPVSEVLLPAFSKIQGSNSNLGNAYLKSVRHMAFIALPALAGLALTADLLIPLLWGERWLPIVLPLRILCGCAFLNVIFLPIDSIFYCNNRPSVPFIFNFGRAVISAASVYILGLKLGLVGVALGMLIGVALSFFYAFYAFKMLLYPFKEFFNSLIPSALATGGMSGFVVLTRIVLGKGQANTMIVIVLAVLVGVCSYLGIFRSAFRAQFNELLDTAKMVFQFRG